MSGGAFDFVDDAPDVRGGQGVETVRQRPTAGARIADSRQQPIECPVLAEEQNLFLAREVMIEVGGRQIRFDRDITHAGGGETAAAEHAGGCPEDLDPPSLGAPLGSFRTAVRKSNHGSMLPQMENRAAVSVTLIAARG